MLEGGDGVLVLGVWGEGDAEQKLTSAASDTSSPCTDDLLEVVEWDRRQRLARYPPAAVARATATQGVWCAQCRQSSTGSGASRPGAHPTTAPPLARQLLQPSTTFINNTLWLLDRACGHGSTTPRWAP